MENRVKHRKRNLRQDKRIRLMIRMAALAGMAVLVMTGCAAQPQWGEQSSPATDRADTGFVAAGPGSYDSADTAILVGRNEEEDTLTFLNLNLGKRYTLSIDGTTRFCDRYGRALSLGQLQSGDIVDITFLKSKKRLNTLQLSTRAWSYTDIERYEINAARGEISIGSDVYRITPNTQYISEGKNIELMDINSGDVLAFQGIDSQVLTVRVEKGHGYLRLVNDENFVGGWIEIGQRQIERIREDMLLVVPEGSYPVSVSNKGGSGTKDVVIRRNEETLFDVGDFEIPQPQTGRVLFSVTPPAAELYIDGIKADISYPVTLEYGLHQMIVRAEGYHSITQYIRVTQETSGIDVVLDEIKEEEASSSGSSSSSSGSSSAADTIADYYKIYVDAPEGVEVYLDGNYVGIAPCSFRKVPGVHVILLRKSGYNARSYTIQVDSEEKDTTYSFVDLTTVSSGQQAGDD